METVNQAAALWTLKTSPKTSTTEVHKRSAMTSKRRWHALACRRIDRYTQLLFIRPGAG
jgi:hypothetical protein